MSEASALTTIYAMEADDKQDAVEQKREVTRFAKTMQKEIEKNSKFVLKSLDMVNRQGRTSAAALLFVAAFIQLILPEHLVTGSTFFLPPIEILLGALFIVWQKVFEQHHTWMRRITVSLTFVICFGNALSTGFLIEKIIQDETLTATNLLMAAGVVWFTNVVTFALLYWEFDRGGPVARVINGWQHADFLFPQMTIEVDDQPRKQLFREEWEPHYFDYLYLAMTNATAFSPTDVMPLTWKAKALMGSQSIVSLVTVTLVAARAVNIL